MPNYFKYNPSGSEINSFFSNNWAIGLAKAGLGPSNVTDFYTGAVIPSGGYAIYDSEKVYVATNKSGVTARAQHLGHSVQYQTQEAAFLGSVNWILDQSNMTILDSDYVNLNTNSLIYHIDAGFMPSYGGSGTNVNGVSSNTTTNTLTNGTLYDSSNGGVFEFAGDNDSIVSDITSNTDFTSDFTVSLFFKQTDTDNTTFPRLFDKSDDSTGKNGFGVFLYDNNSNDTDSVLYLKLQDNTPSLVSGLSFSVNTWYHLTVSFKSSSYVVFVNGGSGTTINHSRSLTNITTSDNFVIGNNNDANRPFAGEIALVSIYDTAISQSANLSNFNAHKARFGL